MSLSIVGLEKRRSGIYWLRRRVPAAVQASVGRKVITESLRTRDPLLAEALFRERMATITTAWQRHRSSPDVASHRLLASLAGEFYRSIVAANAEEPGDPARWRREIERATDRRPERPRRVMGPVGSGVAEEMNEFLECRGFTAAGRYPEAVRLFYSAKMHALRAVLRMSEGEYSPLPDAPSYPAFAPLDVRPARSGEPLTVEGSWDEYARKAKIQPGTVKRWKPLLLNLSAFLKKKDLSTVTAADAMRWVDHLEQGGPKQLTALTINDAYLAAARSFFKWAKNGKIIDANPFDGLAVRKDKERFGTPPGPQGFTDVEADLILTETLRPADPRASAFGAAARRWVPWLCAYTGARVNEVTQARGCDFFARSAGEKVVWIFRITPDAGTVKDGRARDVPLHPHLIEQGFIDFVDGRLGPLFYDPARRGTVANPTYRKVGDKLAAWVRGLGIDRDVAPNHGWRHRFKTLARGLMTDEVRDHIAGHKPRTVGESYGDHLDIALLDAIKRLPRYEVKPPAADRPRGSAANRRSASRVATARRARERVQVAAGP